MHSQAGCTYIYTYIYTHTHIHTYIYGTEPRYSMHSRAGYIYTYIHTYIHGIGILTENAFTGWLYTYKHIHTYIHTWHRNPDEDSIHNLGVSTHTYIYTYIHEIGIPIKIPFTSWETSQIKNNVSTLSGPASVSYTCCKDNQYVIYTCMHLCMYECVCMYVRVYACMHACMYA